MKKITGYFQIIMDTPWKFINELRMYLIKPFVLFYLEVICGVEIGKGSKFYGFPKILKHRNSKIIIGDNFECRNWKFSNPLGINHPTILSTWKNKAILKIGDNVGVSGGSIVAAGKIEIGDGVLIGANSIIIDTDFHPIKSNKRRYDKVNVKTEAVYIGNNVFIGTNCLILKGANVADHNIISAGSVAKRKNIRFQSKIVI